MKKRNEPSDKLCMIFDHCSQQGGYNRDDCAKCPLNPGMSHAAFVKLELKRVIGFLQSIGMDVFLRYTRVCVFSRLLFDHLLMPFLLGALVLRLLLLLLELFAV